MFFALWLFSLTLFSVVKALKGMYVELTKNKLEWGKMDMFLGERMKPLKCNVIGGKAKPYL